MITTINEFKNYINESIQNPTFKDLLISMHLITPGGFEVKINPDGTLSHNLDGRFISQLTDNEEKLKRREAKRKLGIMLKAFRIIFNKVKLDNRGFFNNAASEYTGNKLPDVLSKTRSVINKLTQEDLEKIVNGQSLNITNYVDGTLDAYVE